MQVKFASILLLCVAFSMLLSAQTQPSATPLVKLSGTVSDSSNGMPLSGATVLLPEVHRSTITDVNGSFILDSVSIVPHFMIVTDSGYLVKHLSLAGADFSVPYTTKVALVKTPVVVDSGHTTATVDSTKLRKPIITNADTTKPSTPVSQATRTVKGRVIDKKTKQPVLGALLSISPIRATTAANVNGEFSFNIPAVSVCTLTVTKSSYEQATIMVDSTMATKPFDIELSHSSVYELQDMSINADRINVKQMVKTSDKISQVQMAPELVAKLPSVGQADLFRSLQLLPGVSGTNEASSGLYVRGGTPDQNLIMLNGIPVYYVDHFYGFFSAFNPRAIDDVTMYKGGFGAEYGGRLSSVVELTSKGKDLSADSCSTVAGLGVGLLSGDAFVQVPLINKDIGTLMIAGRRAMTDIIKTNLFDQLFNQMHGSNDTLNSRSTGRGAAGIGGLQNNRIEYQPTFSFWDLNAIAAFKLGAHGMLTTTFFGSNDNQDNSLDTSWSTKTITPTVRRSTGTTPGTFTMDTVRFDTVRTVSTINNSAPLSWGNLCASQGWEQQWTDRIKTRLNISYSQFLDNDNQTNVRTDSTSNRYSDTTHAHDTATGSTSGVKSTNKITDLTGRLDNSLKINDWNKITIGVEGSRKIVTYERDTIIPTAAGGFGPAVDTAAQNRAAHIRSYDTSLTASGYAEDEITFGDKASITPGLRAYYFRLIHDYAVDPRINGWYKPTPQIKLKAAWGLYTQEIHRVEEEDISGGSKYVWLLTNSNRPLERSQHIIGGASWETTHFLLDAEGYIKSFDGLLTISERMRNARSVGQPFNPDQLALFQGTGLAKGIELLAQIKNVQFSILNKNTTYDAWAAYTLSRVENTYDVFNSGNPFPASQDHTHEIKLVNTLEWDVAKWSSLDFSAVWLYSTGAPYTAPLGVYTLTLLDSTTQHTYNHVSDKNAYRLPDYHRLDLSLTWKTHFGKHVEGSLTGGLFNAYNRQNILERTYTENTVGGGAGGFGGFGGASGNQTSVFTEVDRNAMPIMPNIAIEITAKF